MKKTLLSLPFLLWAAIALAQAPATPVPVPATAAVEQPAAPAVEPAAVPDVVKVEGDKITVNDVVTDAKGVAEAFKVLKAAKGAGDKLAARLALMGLLAAIFKILLSCLKFTSEFWKGAKGKLVLRLSTLVLGIGVTLLSHFAAGEDWMSAIMLGISGPLAISIHELFDVIVALVQKKPVPPAPAPAK
jgi:hypothetical protein